MKKQPIKINIKHTVISFGMIGYLNFEFCSSHSVDQIKFLNSQNKTKNYFRS